jgi:hypothetical protein
MALNGHHNRAAEMSVFGGRADIDHSKTDMFSGCSIVTSAFVSPSDFFCERLESLCRELTVHRFRAFNKIAQVL